MYDLLKAALSFKFKSTDYEATTRNPPCTEYYYDESPVLVKLSKERIVFFDENGDSTSGATLDLLDQEKALIKIVQL